MTLVLIILMCQFNGAFTLKGDIIPDISNVYTIGSSTHPIKDLYLGANSLYVNNKKIIEDDSDTIIILLMMTNI